MAWSLEDLLNQIREMLANPVAWENAGLGFLPSDKVQALVEERARNLAAWLWLEFLEGR